MYAIRSYYEHGEGTAVADGTGGSVDSERVAFGYRADESVLRDIGNLLKNKYIYLMSGIIFMGYAVFWTVYYIGGFLQTNKLMDAVTVGTITVIILWMRPVGGFLGGFLADKIGKPKTNGIALAGAAVLLVAAAVLPLMGFGISALVVLLGVFLYMIRGTYWSFLGMSKIPAATMGTAIGLISFIGYLPRITSYNVCYTKLLRGARAVTPPIPGREQAHVFTLRNINDMLRIESFLVEKKPSTAAIVGTGFIGLEMSYNFV